MADWFNWLHSSLERVHPEWRPILECVMQELYTTDQAYLDELIRSEYLPNDFRIFSAFALAPKDTNYVLFGEGPYPRVNSATGFAFMDGAVESLWIDDRIGFSKPVNRATSLRNFLKMILRAHNHVEAKQYSGDAFTHSLSMISARFEWVETLPELQANLLDRGFLLLNASLVFRPHVSPKKDAQFWLKFVERVLHVLYEISPNQVTLILWGKIAEPINNLQVSKYFNKISSEHPYNLSFIENQAMWEIFRPLHIIEKKPC